MSIITDDTIRDFVKKYINNEKHLLPPELQSIDIGQWDVSNVTNMKLMFYGASSFNEPLNEWNVSNVTNMRFMFANAVSFNQPLNKWNVSNVENMGYMFRGASSFNQALNEWNVSNVENMEYMFCNTSSFNQPLNDWDVSNVENMDSMFSNAVSFNQPLNKWNVSNVENMEHMFFNASSFNQPLNDWDVSNVKNMKFMFIGATSLNNANRPNFLQRPTRIISAPMPTEFPSGPKLPSALKTVSFYNAISLEDETLENYFTENATDGPFVIKFNHNYYATSIKDLLQQQTKWNDPVEFVECKEDTPASWQGNAYAQWKKEGSLVFVKLEVAGAKVLVEKPIWLWSGENRPSAVFNLVPRGKVHKFMSTHLLPMRENFNALGSEHCNQTIEQMSYRLEPLDASQLGGRRNRCKKKTRIKSRKIKSRRIKSRKIKSRRIKSRRIKKSK